MLFWVVSNFFFGGGSVIAWNVYQSYVNQGLPVQRNLWRLFAFSLWRDETCFALELGKGMFFLCRNEYSLWKRVSIFRLYIPAELLIHINCHPGVSQRLQKPYSVPLLSQLPEHVNVLRLTKLLKTNFFDEANFQLKTSKF